MKKINVFWFRRDLRLDDNHGLHEALKADKPVLPLFIFDKIILGKLEEKEDKRLTFIHHFLDRMNVVLDHHGSAVKIMHDEPLQAFKKLVEEYDIETVFTNRDYEPYARHRDEKVGSFLAEKGIGFETFKDQVIFEKEEILKDDGKPYMVYTPYSKKWLEKLDEGELPRYNISALGENFLKTGQLHMPSLHELNFKKIDFSFPSSEVLDDLIRNYEQFRNIPALEATSRLGVHLRFGTISIRKLVNHVRNLSTTYLKELIWREFFMMILWHFPQTIDKAFKPRYDAIAWRNDTRDFKDWCDGRTGFPMVDAGMRELNATGFMHNRVRMITASFLVKHLLIDWRWGESYFAMKLLDFEQSSNVGNWQWVTGSGCDAAPYFRIFNPGTQQEKFDPEMKYCKKWIPELGTSKYPDPVTDHKSARERALRVYKEAVSNEA
ncbi:MAG: DNA photolyase family protein [Bacteroidales bacterium]|nr:DNA photolyase family protein [Bacteroidales bacterium]MCF8398492.1 DNA photolyase family protein [Bacteroidales bacterium]